MSSSDNTNLAVSDQKCIGSPTNAKDAYRWIADGYPIELMVADMTNVSQEIG